MDTNLTRGDRVAEDSSSLGTVLLFLFCVSWIRLGEFRQISPIGRAVFDSHADDDQMFLFWRGGAEDRRDAEDFGDLHPDSNTVIASGIRRRPSF
jgi:hypothetical protein